jgi:rod shape-determining protein MreB
MAAAVGADLPVLQAHGSMVVDIGGGTTEIAVISLGGIVVSRSLKLGGDRLDEAIVSHLRNKCNFQIGERTAEALKISHGYFGTPAGRPPVRVPGQDLRRLGPGTLEIREEDVGAAICEPLREIVEAVVSVLEQTPPELARDIAESQLVLAGGGASITGFAEALSRSLGIRVRVAEEPLLCAARGTGKILGDPLLFRSLFPPSRSLVGRWLRYIRSGTSENSSPSSR